MEKGLQRLLEKILKRPTDGVLVDRFLALLSELTEDEKIASTEELAAALADTGPEQSLRVAHMLFNADPSRPRPLEIMAAALKRQGRFAKAAVIENEIARMKSTGGVSILSLDAVESSEDETPPEQPSVQPEAVEFSLADEGELEPLPSELSLQDFSSDTMQARLHQGDGGTQHSAPAAPQESPLQSHAGEDFVFHAPKDEAPAGPAQESRRHNDLPAAWEDSLFKERKVRKRKRGGLQDKIFGFAEKLSAAPRILTPPVPVAAKDEKPASKSGAGKKNEEPQAPAAPTPGLPAPAAKTPMRPMSQAEFWRPLHADLGQAVPDLEMLRQLNVTTYDDDEEMRRTSRRVLRPLVGTLNALVAASSKKAPSPGTAYLALHWDVVQALWGGLIHPNGATYLEEVQLQTTSLPFWTFYLDSLLAGGGGRKVMVEVRKVLEEKRDLSWAEAAWPRLNLAWTQLRVRGPIWKREDGLGKLLELLQIRPSPTHASALAQKPPEPSPG